jgi:hypothetical protein
MKSPFPGMDPYIEASGLWGDFHNTLIAEIARFLAGALPRGYVARTGRRSYVVPIEDEEKKDAPFLPDVSVTAPAGRKPGSSKAGGASVASPPPEPEFVPMRAFIEEDYEERFIDVYELKPERRLVTSIEVLSPSNKVRRSPGWKKYLRKRQALLMGNASLVEIDLLRGGQKMPMLDPWPDSPYTLLVAREEQAPRCRAWPAFFDRPLPPIPVPLVKPDPDVALALQPLVDAIYERGHYGEEIDYSRPLEPPPNPEEAALLAKLLPPPPKRARPRRERRR